MMAARWGDIERDIAGSRRHFGMSVEFLAKVKSAATADERYVARGAFMHAMLAGYTSFENAMKGVTGLLDEPLPTGETGTRL